MDNEFDKRNGDGKMRIRRDDGFVMIQVLALIMIILLFLTSLFSTSGFRHRLALLRIQKEEARYAAEAALQLMEKEIANGNTEWIETGLKRTETILEFESEDGEIQVAIPIMIWANYEDEELCLFAEVEVGSKKERVQAVLEIPKKENLMTDSNSAPATSSTAIQAEGKEQ